MADIRAAATSALAQQQLQAAAEAKAKSIAEAEAKAKALAEKKKIPNSNGTLPTHTPLFVVLLIAVVVIVGALSFFPALALGPIVEHILWTKN